jgi:hypothetical protein
VVGTGAELADDNSTLVEFILSPEGESTRMTVVESGFRDLAGHERDRQRHVDAHRAGWERELGELGEYLARKMGTAD